VEVDKGVAVEEMIRQLQGCCCPACGNVATQECESPIV
jgi:hypothetical protein